MKPKIYCDFDGVIVNTIATIISLYNEDFKYYTNFSAIKWWEVNSWDFQECTCCSKDYINTYFNQPRFFVNLSYMDCAKEILDELSRDYEIVIISIGEVANLRLKEIWIKENLPYCKFIGIDNTQHNDKSNIDMSDGILIDDFINNLLSSNALINICFGNLYTWNEKWEGIRCNNWNDIKRILKGGE